MNRLCLGLAALALAACGPAKVEPSQAPPAEALEPLTPANAASLAATTIAVLPEGSQQQAEGVARVVGLEHEGAKLFSVVGGDPALNGEYLYLHLSPDPSESKTFQIGDFNSWQVVSQTADSVVLQVSHSTMGDNGDVVTAHQRLKVSLPDITDDAITMTPE